MPVIILMKRKFTSLQVTSTSVALVFTFVYREIAMLLTKAVEYFVIMRRLTQ